MADQKLLDRIRKIWAKAESLKAMGKEYEGEAMEAAAQAQKMLTKYKLELSDLELTVLEKEEPVQGDYITGDPTARRSTPTWALDLAQVVANAHFCRILFIRNRDTLMIIGRETDRKITEYIFTTLRRFADETSDKEARKFRKNLRKQVGATFGQNKDFRAAWLKAFTQRISERYAAEKESLRIEAQKTGMSLVRLTNAMAEVDKVTRALTTGKARVRRERVSANQAGASAGRAAGDRATIRGTGLGSGSGNQRLLG